MMENEEARDEAREEAREEVEKEEVESKLFLNYIFSLKMNLFNNI